MLHRKSNRIVITILALLMSPCAMAAAAVERPLLPIIQPLPIQFERNDLHVMLYFEGHPRYEAVEAMIRMRNGHPPQVRAILTRHDQNQSHYLNDRELASRLTSTARKVHFADMDFRQQVDKKGRPQVQLTFRTHEDEQVEMDLTAVGQPLSKYAGLADPGNHAATSSLPVMYRDRSTLAHPDSQIRIDGRAYKIPRKVWVPIFFTGMQGYYSDNFRHGVLHAFAPQPVSLDAAPTELVSGAEWRYRRGDREVTYRIVSVDGRRIVAQGPQERLLLENGNSGLSLLSVEHAAGDDRSSTFRVSFSPAMPVLGGNQPSNWQGRFTIAVDGQEGLVTGQAVSCRLHQSAHLVLLPQLPTWAVARPLRIALQAGGVHSTLAGGIGTNLSAEESACVSDALSAKPR